MLARTPITRRRALFVLAASLPACVTVAPPEAPPTASAVPLGELVLVAPSMQGGAFRGGDNLRQTLARVHDIAYRLRTRSLGRCGSRQVAQYGFVAGNLAALRALQLEPSTAESDPDERLAVWHVVAGSPAAGAGLREGDVIERIGADAVPAGVAGLEALRSALASAEARRHGLSLQVRRGAAALALNLHAEPGCDIPAVLASDHLLPWAGGELLLAEAPDAMLAFALAHSAALRLNGPGRGLAVGGAEIGEGIDFTLSMFSLALGLATLGGWSAKPVDLFHGSEGSGRAAAEARLREEAELAADALALKMLHQAGFDAEPMFVVWERHADRLDAAGMRQRLGRLREQWARRGAEAGPR